LPARRDNDHQAKDSEKQLFHGKSRRDHREGKITIAIVENREFGTIRRILGPRT
jgi:hypothetical protein